MRVGDDHVHHAVRRQRRIPGKRLVDALRRLAVGFEQQVFRSARIAQMRPGQRRVCRGHRHAALGACDRPRVGRLEPEAAGAIDRSDQDLQHVQRARGLEAVGMGRDMPRMA
jgi:hypothetical protein